MDTYNSPITREEFMAWLKDGRDMLTVERTNAWACFIKLPKRDGIDYIFHQEGYHCEPLGRDGHFDFAGIYMRAEQKLYCPCISTRAVSDWKNDPNTTEGDLRKIFCQAVNMRIEEMVKGGGVGIDELMDTGLKSEIESYRDCRAEGIAAQEYIDSVPLENIRYRANYQVYQWDDGMLDFLQDRDGYAMRIAGEYVMFHQEDILAELLRIGAVREKYAAIIADQSSPIHLMKKISDAVRSSGAATVRVTIEKDGVQATIRTSAKSLSGYHPAYDDFDAPIPDRKTFSEAFGKWANYTAQDIRRITYGRKTIYEAPEQKTVQSEAPAKGFTMTMGGI